MSWASDKAREVAHYTLICQPGEDMLTALARTAMEVAIARAAEVAEHMIVGGRAWTEEQTIAAKALTEAGARIRALGEPDR